MGANPLPNGAGSRTPELTSRSAPSEVSALPVNGDREAGTGHKDENPKRLGTAPLIDPTARVRNSVIGEWTWIGPNTSIDETTFGDYSYVAGDAQIIYATVGKWCSLASHVRLNPGNHPTWRVMQHHATYRRTQYGFAPTDDEDFFQWRRDHAVTIGHDVWIGHGAVVMPGVSIGNGAVIGSSAVGHIPPSPTGRPRSTVTGSALWKHRCATPSTFPSRSIAEPCTSSRMLSTPSMCH
ncbi:MAG: hypothetical protein EBV45_03620 [Chloroflexi bacterium]|nr:hypothetical protein [Chloroflexota bacterium]